MKYKPVLPKTHPNYKYDKKWHQLEALCQDKDYWVHGSGYKLFLEKMIKKITKGEKITSKMDAAITKAVKSYQSFLYPSAMTKQRTRLLVKPLNKCIDLLQEVYSNGYIDKKQYWNNFEFMDSIKTSAKAYGSLTNKQKLVMNKKYKELLKIKDIQEQAAAYHVRNG